MNTEQRGGKGLGLPGIESPLPQDIGIEVLDSLPYTGPFLLGRSIALGNRVNEAASQRFFNLELTQQADSFVAGNISGIVERVASEFLVEPNKQSEALLKATAYKSVGDLGKRAWVNYLTEEHPAMKNDRSGITTETLSLSAATRVAGGLMSQYDTQYTNRYFDQLTQEVKTRLREHITRMKGASEAIPPLIAKIQEASNKDRFMERISRSLAATLVLQEEATLTDTLAERRVKGIVTKEGKEDVIGMQVTTRVDSKKGMVEASLPIERIASGALNAILQGAGYDVLKANKAKEAEAATSIGKALASGDFGGDKALLSQAYRQSVADEVAKEVNYERHNPTRVQRIAREGAQIARNIATKEGAARVTATTVAVAPTIYYAADAFLGKGKATSQVAHADSVTQALPALSHIDIQAGIQALEKAGVVVTEFTIPTILKQVGVATGICLLTDACVKLGEQPPQPPTKDVPMPPTLRQDNPTATATVTASQTPEAKASPTPALVLKLDTILGARGGSGLVMENVRTIDNNGSHTVLGFDTTPTFYSAAIASTQESVNVLNAYPDPQALIGSDGSPMHITNLTDAVAGDVLTYIQKDGTFVATPLFYPKQWNGVNVQVAFHFETGNTPKVYFVTVNGEVVGSIDMPLLPVPPGKAVYFDPYAGKYMMGSILRGMGGQYLRNPDGSYKFDPFPSVVKDWLQITPIHPAPTAPATPTSSPVVEKTPVPISPEQVVDARLENVAPFLFSGVPAPDITTRINSGGLAGLEQQEQGIVRILRDAQGNPAGVVITGGDHALQSNYGLTASEMAQHYIDAVNIINSVDPQLMANMRDNYRFAGIFYDDASFKVVNNGTTSVFFNRNGLTPGLVNTDKMGSGYSAILVNKNNFTGLEWNADYPTDPTKAVPIDPVNEAMDHILHEGGRIIGDMSGHINDNNTFTYNWMKDWINRHISPNDPRYGQLMNANEVAFDRAGRQN